DLGSALSVARTPGRKVFLQSPSDEEIRRLSIAADEAGVLGKSLWLQKGDYTRLHLANDLVDEIVVSHKIPATARPPESELLRILRPGGQCVILSDKSIVKPERTIVKPYPKDTDEW